jgi:hypothetical protein
MSLFQFNERISNFLHIAVAAPFILGAFAVVTHLAANFI